MLRPGAVAPLAALLMIPLLGMLAFSIDLSYAATVRSDLQSAADAAALAGASNMQQSFVQYNYPTITSTQQSSIVSTVTGTSSGSPTKIAESTAASNKAGGVSITVPDADVTFGYTNTSGSYSSTYSAFPNTIQVVTRRDSNQNGSLAFFFGPLLGVSSTNLTATARATIYVGNITSLQAIAGIDSHILPVALDYKSWTNFMSTGQNRDGTTSTGPNGYPQLQVYPDPGNAPGQFGLLDVGPPQNNVPAFQTWIDDGVTPNDIDYLLNNNLIPVSPSAPEEWKGGPGMKSTLQSNFASVEGQPTLIPIFQAVQYSPSYIAASGNGQGSYYAIIGFVGVTVTTATARGSNMTIAVQPYGVTDPTTVINNPFPAGESQSSISTSPTTFVSAKLTY
jgi:Flp pilus assembly protein TadG